MNHKERMLAELPYKAWLDGLIDDRNFAKKMCFKYNRCSPQNKNKRTKILAKLLGSFKGAITIEPNFFCDYGYNIEIGENFYSNHNLVILDCAKIKIGDNVMFGQNCSIITAGHPVHPKTRLSGYEYAISITIGNKVWLGSNVVVNPGVKIGDNVVIGSGSIVTKDLEANSIYAGVPCKKIRDITDADRKYYFKDRTFDVDDY